MNQGDPLRDATSMLSRLLPNLLGSNSQQFDAPAVPPGRFARLAPTPALRASAGCVEGWRWSGVTVRVLPQLIEQRTEREDICRSNATRG